MREDAGARTAAGWATDISPGPESESGQSIAFHVANDAPGLFGTQPQVRPDGTLTYRAAANASGVATVTLRAVDNGGTENGGTDTSPPQTFTIAVTPANDPPGFVAGPDEDVLEDTGAHTVADWATGVTSGPADEGGQSVSFAVTNDNPGLFSTQPRIQPDGALAYAAAANASGSRRSRSGPWTTAAPRWAAATPARPRPSRSRSPPSTTCPHSRPAPASWS